MRDKRSTRIKYKKNKTVSHVVHSVVSQKEPKKVLAFAETLSFAALAVAAASIGAPIIDSRPDSPTAPEVMAPEEIEPPTEPKPQIVLQNPDRDARAVRTRRRAILQAVVSRYSHGQKHLPGGFDGTYVDISQL